MNLWEAEELAARLHMLSVLILFPPSLIILLPFVPVVHLSAPRGYLRLVTSYLFTANVTLLKVQA